MKLILELNSEFDLENLGHFIDGIDIDKEFIKSIKFEKEVESGN